MLEETQVNAVNNNNGEDTKNNPSNKKNPDIMYVSIMFSQSKIWQKFIEIVKECVEKKHNGKERGYPIIKLNMDNSVSIYMSSHEEKFLLEADSKIKVDRTFFTSGFDKQAENFNLSLIDNQERALTIIDERSIDVVQYKFNFSIYDLDTILKQNVHYTGYKDQQRLLSILKKNIPLKPGMIRLFPLLTDPINDKASMIRVAGCQTITAISVQLVQLYSPEITDIKINHGMAIGMKEKVGLDGMQVINAVIDILMAEGLLNDRKDFPPFGGTGLITILNPSNEGPLKISEMDASSRDFYAHYGSCGTEELKICKSLEVDTLCLLNYFRQTLDFLVARDEKEGNPEKIEKYKESIQTVSKLIEQERERLIVNRDINNFKGNVIFFDCNKSDIENIKKQIKDTSDTIYTVNQNTAQNPDLVARIESKTAMASLPSNRFDLVCFNIGSSAHIKLEQAFETANRILKDNGVLVFINCDIEINEKNFKTKLTFFGYNPNTEPKNLNRIIKSSDGNNFYLDIAGMLALTDFKSAKLIKANHANDNQVNGAVLIATKSGEIIDLDEVCRRIPELEIVLENNNLKLDINSSSVAAFN